MLKTLQQPYPYSDSDRRKIFLSLGAGFFIGLFLIYFEPFGINELHSPNKILILSGYGIITSVTMLFLYFIVPKISPNYFKEENWTVGREIIQLMLNIILIAFLNVLYSQIVLSLEFTIYSLFSMVGYTFILGIFPTIGIVFSNYIYYLKQYSTPPQPTFLSEKTQRSELILVAENENDTLKLLTSNLLYIESSDNYSTVVFLKDEQITKELIRSSLTRLEGQIQVKSIVRCHRSFIVNLDKVIKVSGNAQGFKLQLGGTDFIVPVARKYSEIVHRFR
jgi:LytTr DNA-binding domain